MNLTMKNLDKISMLEEKPAFLRKREQKQEMLTKVKLYDPVELQVFIESSDKNKHFRAFK